MYAKVFSSILDSSLWDEPTPTRIVWFTLLLSMDQDGYAHFATVNALARRAVVTVDECVTAVTLLERADPNSTDTEHEGSRIERVPGGWMVLNSQKYRMVVTVADAREATRLRVAKHRALKKLQKEQISVISDVTPRVTDVTNVTERNGSPSVSASVSIVSGGAGGEPVALHEPEPEKCTCDGEKAKAPPEPPPPPPPPNPWEVQFGCEMPHPLRTEGCLTALGQWLQYKKESGSNYKPTGFKIALAKWGREFTAATFPAAVETSIASGWKGLFPQQATGRAGGAPTNLADIPPSPAAKELARLYALKKKANDEYLMCYGHPMTFQDHYAPPTEEDLAKLQMKRIIAEQTAKAWKAYHDEHSELSPEPKPKDLT